MSDEQKVPLQQAGIKWDSPYLPIVLAMYYGVLTMLLEKVSDHSFSTWLCVMYLLFVQPLIFLGIPGEIHRYFKKANPDAATPKH